MNKTAVTFIILCLSVCIQLIIGFFGNLNPADNRLGGVSLSKDIRIVSLSPAITEMVYLLNMEDNLAGVTKYCAYPQSASKKPKIGGYYDPNLELILKLKPDYVILGTEHKAFSRKLTELNIKTIPLDNSSPSNIERSILTLGKIFGKDIIAKQITDNARAKIKYFRDLTKEIQKPKVMLVFGQDMAGGIKDKMYLIGNDPFYTPIIEAVGGENIIKNSTSNYPMISIETAIKLNPDIIVELHSEVDNRKYGSLDYKWTKLKSVNAVKNNRIYVISSDYAFIPGPRFIKIAEDFIKIIHPELKDKISYARANSY